MWNSIRLLALVGLGSIGFGQTNISLRPGSIPITATIDGPITAVADLDIATGAGLPVQFKYDHVNPTLNDPPNFIVVSPSSGVAPARVKIALNEKVIRQMAPRSYSLTVVFTTVGQTPSVSAGATILLNLGLEAVPTIQTIVNSASMQPTVSPGEIVTLFGKSLGYSAGSSTFDASGLYPTTFGSATVTFNGIPAPLLYVSPNQINAVVPNGVTGKSVDIVASRYIFAYTAPFTVPLTDTSPGIFSSTPGGTGQGAILNYPQNTYNSAGNPAAKGSVIVFYATGVGVWDPPVEDGAITLSANRFTAKPVSLTIGGQPAIVYYAGTSPFQLWGLLQVIAYVPTSIGSGDQPVVLRIGENDNSQQKVTMAVQ